jgi:hypothetical protein
MEVTLNSNYFSPQRDLPVYVFEYWTVKANLIRECVPVADHYNVERVSGVRKLVGYGKMLHPDKPGRWRKDDWIVEWDRKEPTPDYPYAGWKKRLILHHFRQVFKFLFAGRFGLLLDYYDRRFLRWFWQELRS